MLADGAHRIGHGVRLRADTNLVDGGSPGDLVLGPLAQYVLDHQIHLEMAPTCNGRADRRSAQRRRPSDRAVPRVGFNVGYNTDNRVMSNVMPSSELHAVVVADQLDSAEMERLATNAMMSSFAPMDVRHRIVAEQIQPGYR